MIVVVSALIIQNGRACLTQRRSMQKCAFLWETPGGKQEGNESFHDTLRRELKEELGIVVGDIPEQAAAATIIPPGLENTEFQLLTFIVTDFQGEPRPLEGQGIGWFLPSEINNLRLTPGNEATRGEIKAAFDVLAWAALRRAKGDPLFQPAPGRASLGPVPILDQDGQPSGIVASSMSAGDWGPQEIKVTLEHPTNQFITVARFAAHAHDKRSKTEAGRFRQVTGAPYFTHPWRVALDVILRPDSTAPMGLAALCHDLLEDTTVTEAELRTMIGDVATGYVIELTNKFTKEQHPELNRKQRKERELLRLCGISYEAKTIKLIDRIDNLSDAPFTDDDGSDFREVYIHESETLCASIGTVAPDLADKLFALIRKHKQSV